METVAERQIHLAHLSDPHLTDLNGLRISQLMNKRILGYLSWLKGRRRNYRREILDVVVEDIHRTSAERILVSGDLTHIGLPQECIEASRWLKSLGRPDEVRAIPGNHERYAHSDWASTLGRFSEYLGADAPEDFPTLMEHRQVAVIGVNSAVVTAPFFAAGEVGGAQLEKLADLLQKSGSLGMFRLVMIHHSPLLNGHSVRKRLRDAAALTRLIEALGAELVVHGHGHSERIDFISSSKGEIPVLAAPSASRVGEGRAGWNKLGIAQETEHWVISLESRRYFTNAESAEMRTTGSREFRVAR